MKTQCDGIHLLHEQSIGSFHGFCNNRALADSQQPLRIFHVQIELRGRQDYSTALLHSSCVSRQVERYARQAKITYPVVFETEVSMTSY
jgi:hypothetical protein